MARIRIVDEWLRSPASPPTHWRSVMVVAEQWAEQRVLMRAYAESADQTRPTIVFHGVELAIGPAGTDPHGPWGVHVHPPVDGRAQEIAEQLREAARRLAGAKGNPARLADEVSEFERKRTDNWSPGAPRALPGGPPRGYHEPVVAASQANLPASSVSAGWSQPVTYVPSQAATVVPVHAPVAVVPPSAVPTPPPVAAVAPVIAHSPDGAQRDQRITPVPMAAAQPPDGDPGATRVGRRRRGWTSPIPPRAAEPFGARTALGYESGAGAQSAIIRLGLRPATASQLGRIGHVTVPADFEITPYERDVLNALGEAGHLTARAIGQMIGVEDPVGWMEALIRKLDEHGLDIVVPGQPVGGEPSYRLHR